MERGMRWVFRKMFPRNPKKTYTPEGKWLRTVMGWCCLAHGLAFAACMAFVGWKESMFELALMLISYSAYLTLR